MANLLNELAEVSKYLTEEARDQVLADIVEEAMEELATGASDKEKWIPVSERLPEDGERVLAITKSGNQFVGFHTQFSGWHFEHVIHPTHWMPLPEPPKEN